MKKRKQAARLPSKVEKPCEPLRPQKASSRQSQVIRYSIYALIIAAAVGLRYWFAGPEIPRPALDGLDAALVEDIENARAAVWKSPRQPETWGRLGMLLAAHSFDSEAVACFDKAEGLDPERWKWPYLRCIVLEHVDPAAARDALREAAVVAGEDDSMPRLLLMERLLEIGELEEAERHWRTVLHFWPLHARVNLDGARLRFAQGDAEGALSLLKTTALEDAHTRRTAHQLAAQLTQMLGEKEAAARLVEQLKKLPPDQAWPDPYRDELESYRTAKGAYIARINELGRRGDQIKLKRAVAEAIDRYPELAHLVAGRERLANGDAAGAETALREAIRLDPRSLDAHLSLGEALSLQNKHRKAEGVFRRAVDFEPANGETHLRLGGSLVAQKKYPEAIEALRAGVQFLPTSSKAHQALAEALVAAGKLDEAEEHRRIAERLKSGPAGGQ